MVTTAATPSTHRAVLHGVAVIAAVAIVVAGLASCKDKRCSGSPAHGGTTGSVNARFATGPVFDAPGGRAPKPKPDKKKKPCPPKNSGKKDDKRKDTKMFGAKGPPITSLTLHRGHVRGYDYRIDIENPAPGKRPASMHVQLGGRGSTHYEYNPETKRFVTRDGNPLPRSVQNHIDTDPLAQRRIEVGLRKLGER